MGLTRKKRTIHAPKVALKVIPKWFGFHLANALQFDEFVFGFVKGRSAIDAASRHCGARWIYSVDIEDFFPSTPLDMVRRSLSDLGYSDHGAGLIAKLCCFNGGLAQGSPASPVLSNLVFKSTDEKFLELANSLGICYTRYADDVTFSGTSDFPARVKAEVHSIIEAGGWKVAKNKECIAMLPRRLKVHGLLVHGDKPRLTKGYRNRIRAFKTGCSQRYGAYLEQLDAAASEGLGPFETLNGREVR